MHRYAALPVVALVLVLSACATTGASSQATTRHASRVGLYSLDLPSGFGDAAEADDLWDSMLTWEQRDWAVGVLLDGPLHMEGLDEAVRGNAYRSGFGVDIVDVRDVELGGLYARRTEIILSADEHRVVMFNTHTSTEQESVQLVLSGPVDDARELRELMTRLETGGFRFERRVAGFRVTPYDLRDPSLPIRFSELPAAWRPAQRGSVNEHAFLELTIPNQDTWFMGIHEVLEGELAEEAVNNPDYVDRYARVMHDEMASVLQAVPPGNLEPFDQTGEPTDRRWSLGGHFVEGRVPITYRFRLVQRGPELLRLYCWASPSVDVKGTCDALFDLISLAPAGSETAAAE